MTTEATPREVGSHAGLGLAPERAVVAYLYHDAQTAEDAHPWMHSTMLVLAADRRPTLRNETPLVTLAQAEAIVAAERERHADALRCALEALDYCIEDSAELLNERTVQWGSYRKDRQAAMAATLERHRAVAERLRAMLRA